MEYYLFVIARYLPHLIVLALIIWVISLLIRPKIALKSWHHHFEGMQYNYLLLYEQIMQEIKDRKLPKISCEYNKYYSAGIFSPTREYLCIEYKKFNIDVCCIAFGTGYYVSWWLGQKDPGFLSRVPIIRDLLGMNPKYQSYYQLDTATLFQSGVHDAILSVIDKISSEKGMRPLTEAERTPQLHKF